MESLSEFELWKKLYSGQRASSLSDRFSISYLLAAILVVFGQTQMSPFLLVASC
jgi:hypothetical protein